MVAALVFIHSVSGLDTGIILTSKVSSSQDKSNQKLKFPNLPLPREIRLEVGMGLGVRDEGDREPIAPLGRTL